MFILGFIIGTIVVALIMHRYMSSKIDTAKVQSEQERQEMQTRHESELAAKDSMIAKLENKVASYENREKSFASRWQQLIDRERAVERREQLLAEAVDSKFAQRERELARREHNLEVIIDRRVKEDIKGKEIGIKDNWKIIKREKCTLAANNKKYEEKSAALDEREQEILARAKLIADHLGVPLKCILNPREKKLVGKITNELPEERYKLIDLVMSCPDDQVKALLAEMQQFPRNLRR